MAQRVMLTREDEVNPYIALTDLCINLLLILAFVIAVIGIGTRLDPELARARKWQQEFANEVKRLALTVRPQRAFRHDPAGDQRWMYGQATLFKPGTAQLTGKGYEALEAFGGLLKKYEQRWRRIRVEGHTLPPTPGQPDDWALSCARATSVADVLTARGHIPPYLLAVAGRGGQAPLSEGVRWGPGVERVEIVIEYTGRPLPTT